MGLLLLALLLCAADDAYVQAIREEHRALARAEALVGWYRRAEGRAAQVESIVLRPEAVEAVKRASAAKSGDDALALRFLQRALVREQVATPLSPIDAEVADLEAAATVRLPWRQDLVAYRDMDGLLAQEPDASRREAAFRAVNAVRAAVLNPLLARREEKAQAAVRAAGFPGAAALAEEDRQVDLHALLAQGAAYVEATEGLYRATLDRVSREELGVSREALRRADWNRLWKSPRLLPYFDRSLEMDALRTFLAGLGLGLGAVRIDAEPRPQKQPRAFVAAIEPPFDVRLSVKPAGGLDDYWSLFHEAGHAVHFANARVPWAELASDGYAAPSEAFGELFRRAFADPGWLRRYRQFLRARNQPVPDDRALAAILRRTALAEMYFIRRYAFAKVAYELRLHGGAAAESLPALYRQLFSAASGIALDGDDAQLFRTDVDDDFSCADYARAFVLAGMLHDALRQRFGEGWSGDPRAGAFLRSELFAPGTSLSADEVARRLGFPGLDFKSAPARAERLVAEADALEEAQ